MEVHESEISRYKSELIQLEKVLFEYSKVAPDGKSPKDLLAWFIESTEKNLAIYKQNAIQK